MRKESDRAAAIIGAALVEDCLSAAIRATLVNRENEDALWFDQGSPFGTLRAKTVAAYGLGLCTKKVADEIDAIRLIRNQFSHALRPITFRHDEIAAACAGLGSYVLFDLGDPKPDPTLPRFRYEAACTGIWMVLMRKGTEVQGERIEKLRVNALLDNAVAASLTGSANYPLGEVDPK
jgi:hypothetical protein